MSTSTLKRVMATIKDSGGPTNAVSIPRELVRFMGDYESAAMMAQIFYWTDRTDDPDGWIYKTAEDWNTELCLSAAQVRRVSKRLMEVGIEIVFKKNPQHGRAPLYHYRLDWDVFKKAFLHFLDIQQCSSSTTCTPDIEEPAMTMEVTESASSLKGNINLHQKPTSTSLRKQAAESPPPPPPPQPPGGGGRKPDRQPRPEPERPNRTETFIFLHEVVGLRDVPTLNKCAGLPLAGVTAEWERVKAAGKGGGWLVKVILDPGWKPPAAEVVPQRPGPAPYQLPGWYDLSIDEQNAQVRRYESQRAAWQCRRAG